MKSTRNKLLASIGVLIIVIAIVTSVVVINNNNKAGTEDNKTTITISVFDKENSNIFNEAIDTDKEILIDVLKDINELEVVTEDSQYGAYITSIKGIEQGNNYYWSYYINDEYATVGVSSCKIEEGKTYNFKIEEMNY